MGGNRAGGMSLAYYKRYRMVCDLTHRAIAVPELPSGYVWTPWEHGQEDRHALVKFHSFRDEIDSEVFECLGDYHGCYQLMKDITQQSGFLPDATWLITVPGRTGYEDCGTVQGVTVSETTGCIQNVGISPNHRGQGLGRALVERCLLGFQSAGMKRVTLEVTANNTAAVELYRRVGFQTTRTLFRQIDLEYVTSL
jgi:ribosomal protein S18 acetylase RimI-like enzyme